VLSQAGANAYLKLENIQHTGSFKVRGALNKLLSLTPEQRAERRDGVVGQPRFRCGLRAEAARHAWPDLCA
jgi:threonine dehydratase